MPVGMENKKGESPPLPDGQEGKPASVRSLYPSLLLSRLVYD